MFLVESRGAGTVLDREVVAATVGAVGGAVDGVVRLDG
jgi:hypothetical protein